MTHYTLYDFNRLVKNVLQEQLDPSYWIIAEIGQINRHANGHCYLELVEKDDQYIKAKARGTIWANVFRELHPWFESQTGTEIKTGMKILMNATLEFHEVYGLSFNIRDLDANFTIGERERKRQETISRLEQEGILDMNQSLELPAVIQRLAIISSPSAAGYEDFINQFENNSYGYQAKIELFPSVMQGDAAPQSIIESLHKIYECEEIYDAVIVIRGGGSKMDLDCFDDYDLCAHLAQFPFPIITGIGHERDQSIADLVAHTRLKTPTSVAEFIIARMIAFESEMNELHERSLLRARQLIQYQRDWINDLNFKYQLISKQQLQKHRFLLDQAIHQIQIKPRDILNKSQINLDHRYKLISAYDPKHLFQKGYSITRVNGKVLKGQTLKRGDEMETETLNKKITSTVKSIK